MRTTDNKRIGVGLIIVVLIIVIGLYVYLPQSETGQEHLVDYPETDFEHSIDHLDEDNKVILKVDTSKSDKVEMYTDISEEPSTFQTRNTIEIDYTAFEGSKMTYVSMFNGEREVIGTVDIG